ncbi:endonuclease/exonuclease/phosphatase family protein [Aeromicrobium sp.]|nr:endonuclease/exonuclease/phosphatase family protein [Candidatus Saccharibacteria bacterium]
MTSSERGIGDDSRRLLDEALGHARDMDTRHVPPNLRQIPGMYSPTPTIRGISEEASLPYNPTYANNADLEPIVVDPMIKEGIDDHLYASTVLISAESYDNAEAPAIPAARRNKVAKVVAVAAMFAAVAGGGYKLMGIGADPHEKANEQSFQTAPIVQPETTPAKVKSSPQPIASEASTPESIPSVSVEPAPQPAAVEAPIETAPVAVPPVETTITLPDTTFTMAAMNIYYNTDQRRPDYSIDNWRERLDKTIKFIKDPEHPIDVALLSEVRQEPWQVLKESDSIGRGYAIYPKKYEEGYGAQNPIIWNDDIFELVDGKLIDGPQVANPGIHPNSNTMVLLRNRITGMEFYFISTHEPVGDSPQAIQARLDSNNFRADMLLELSSKGIPIIFGGDMNARYAAAPGDKQPAKDNDSQNLMYCKIMNKTNLVDALDGYQHRNDAALPTDCQPKEARRVDHIFATDEMRVKSIDYSVSPVDIGSDVHRPLVTTYVLPGKTVPVPTGVTP